MCQVSLGLPRLVGDRPAVAAQEAVGRRRGGAGRGRRAGGTGAGGTGAGGTGAGGTGAGGTGAGTGTGGTPERVLMGGVVGVLPCAVAASADMPLPPHPPTHAEAAAKAPFKASLRGMSTVIPVFSRSRGDAGADEDARGVVDSNGSQLENLDGEIVSSCSPAGRPECHVQGLMARAEKMPACDACHSLQVSRENTPAAA